MLILRLLAVLLAIAIGACLLAYVMTGSSYYWRLAGKLFRVAVLLAAIFFGLLVLERVLVPFV